MSKRKRGITGDAASKRGEIRKRERRVVETEEERSRRLSTMAQRGQDRRAEETEEPSNSRLLVMAQRGQERRTEETEEQRNRRLAVMGQRSQQRRAEETEEQRNSRLSAMLQHARDVMKDMLLKDKITIRYKLFMQLELFFTLLLKNTTVEKWAISV
ncbi:hypothetical protein AVEN_256823-1 [Araneus ventricosus]|uniref:STPR domain-containing protein n=1 Tax=Araneus ventricosus TaxID=182803 RepID=A0A4Y2LUQ4_ARAVE|nr:hypothetical protein AVEN_256823-1 [Araneus ventricosus]